MLMKMFYQGFSYDLVRKIKHLFAEFVDEQSPISGQIFHFTSGISVREKQKQVFRQSHIGRQCKLVSVVQEAINRKSWQALDYKCQSV